MSWELMLVLWAGLAAGLVHVFAGADHLAALLPLSMGRSWRACWLGLRWGVGHSGGVLIVGLLAVLLKEQIDVELIGAWGERLVGVMLIGIGALGFRWAFRTHVHVHRHKHDGDEHTHLHVHAAAGHEPAETEKHAPAHVHTHTALFAGVLHGVAGTSHLLGVLPAVGMGSWAGSGSYLGGFVGGSIVAMTAFAAIIGGTSARLGDRAPRMLKGAMCFASGLTVAIGIAWIAIPMLGGELP